MLVLQSKPGIILFLKQWITCMGQGGMYESKRLQVCKVEGRLSRVYKWSQLFVISPYNELLVNQVNVPYMPGAGSRLPFIQPISGFSRPVSNMDQDI